MKVFEFNPETGLSEGLKFSGGHVQSRLPGLLEVPGGQLCHPPGAGLVWLLWHHGGPRALGTTLWAHPERKLTIVFP